MLSLASQNACCSTGVWTGSPQPCGCPDPILRSQWMLTMHESMTRYQLHYGLKPIGPHRVLALPLPEGFVTPSCSQCDGGLIEGDGGDTWAICPSCFGFGGGALPDSAEVAALREKVLRDFPDAAAHGASAESIGELKTVLLGRVSLVHDLADNVMRWG